ncbi:hypothetical protein HGA13_27330 [Nocardia speluncae]|uniref:Uncharacterized protein n=1 Tax=Nocardia speluncae TaxID=419477 RepID=A0A846XPY9_9NOCA|nr:hypothetical protein [Nocardia speluncae]NKY36756.1 hypothetical protein [Nocardia speluncae]
MPTAEALEQRIAELRTQVRRAAGSGDRTAARRLRAELRTAEAEWDTAVLGTPAPAEPPRQQSGAVPVREHVHRALTLLSVPAAPKFILTVHEAFFSGDLVAARLTSLRRDEERSFRAAPYARPYYVCAALTTDLLAPARGLLAVSTWPPAQRMVGPLSPRVDLLTAATRLARHLADHGDTAAGQRVLWQLAVSIPGATDGSAIDPHLVLAAAERELEVHRDDDIQQRADAAERAQRQLADPAAQLFGTRLAVAERRRNEA